MRNCPVPALLHSDRTSLRTNTFCFNVLSISACRRSNAPGKKKKTHTDKTSKNPKQFKAKLKES